ncbi:SMP-30/gluconolactonase/LRE family protein [soil metagenome]
MNRRQMLAALPLAGLSAHAALAQPPAAAPPAPPRTPPAPMPLADPALPMTELASGLLFPEGPVVLKDGSVVFVEIARKTVSKLSKDGKVSVLAQLEGGPNGLGVGPDGKLYIANDGGRFTFNMRNGINLPGGAPAGFTNGGMIQKLDLRSGNVETVFDSFDGKKLIAPDDLVFDKQGGMWITEYGLARNSGAIYYAAKGARTLSLARGNISSPNGIGVSPDGKILQVSMGGQLYGFDITGPGKLETNTYPNNGLQAPLYNGGGADSLKIQADGKVCVCTLSRPGGVSVIDKAGKVEFLGFPDPMTCNLAFGGKDLKDVWICLSGTGRIVKVRWPSAGQAPAFRA